MPHCRKANSCSRYVCRSSTNFAQFVCSKLVEGLQRSKRWVYSKLCKTVLDMTDCLSKFGSFPRIHIELKISVHRSRATGGLQESQMVQPARGTHYFWRQAVNPSIPRKLCEVILSSTIRYVKIQDVTSGIKPLNPAESDPISFLCLYRFLYTGIQLWPGGSAVCSQYWLNLRSSHLTIST